MMHPLLQSSALPLAATFGGIVHGTIFVVGVIATLFIIAVIVLCLTMLPDFARYLKIKRM